MHKPTLLAAAIAGCFILPSAAFAQSTAPKNVEVDTINVRGSILPYKLEHIPGSTSVLDTEQLEAQRPFSIKEALRTVPGRAGRARGRRRLVRSGPEHRRAWP